MSRARRAVRTGNARGGGRTATVISQKTARKAAQAVIGAEEKEQLVTKDFLRAEMGELKTDVIKWNVGMLIAMTGIFAAIVKLL
ncbi:MAG: hypothetical protein ACREWE_06500 [Gammaproteobacteria bacterium]